MYNLESYIRIVGTWNFEQFLIDSVSFPWNILNLINWDRINPVTDAAPLYSTWSVSFLAPPSNHTL